MSELLRMARARKPITHAARIPRASLALLLAATVVACGGASDATRAESVADELADLPPPVATSVVLDVLARRGADANVGHPVAQLVLPANTSCGALTTDAENAMLHAIAFARLSTPDRAEHAQAVADIVSSWATAGTTYGGPNGFLCAAWNIGSMARAAYVVKTGRAPAYDAARGAIEGYLRTVAATYWLPPDPTKPLPGTKPEILQGWERTHASNRTMTALEATMHVARLVGDRAWLDTVVAQYKQFAHYQDFRAPTAEPGSGTTYFVDAAGKNGDDFRGDDWHRTAGLAASVQICEVIRAETGEDLYPFDGGILLTSLERYGAIVLSKSDPGAIPFWDTAARAYPGSATLRTIASRLHAVQTGASVPLLVTYSWGFGETLAKVEIAPSAGVRVGGTCYPTCSARAIDPDGDGWGWENQASCVVPGSTPDTRVACVP